VQAAASGERPAESAELDIDDPMLTVSHCRIGTAEDDGRDRSTVDRGGVRIGGLSEEFAQRYLPIAQDRRAACERDDHRLVA
jgi:hypothetical protein